MAKEKKKEKPIEAEKIPPELRREEEEKEGINAEILEDLSPEVKKVVEMGFSMQRYSGSMPNPLLSKLNEKHISDIIDIGKQEESNSYKDAQSNKIYNLLYVILGVGVFIFLLVFLVGKDKDLLMEILKIIVIFGGGFGGGIGYKTYLNKKKAS